MYANKEDALNNRNVLDTQTTNEDGIVTFKRLPAFYDTHYIKESQTLDKYILRDKEKDIISVYRDNGVRFLGEMKPEKMSFIEKDKERKVIETVDNPTEDDNINTYLQSLTDYGSSFNKDTNWLVFNDNGTEKLVSKKPLKFYISWNSLYKAGVVFGKEGIDDLINADFSDTDYYKSSQMGEDAGKGIGKIKENYTPIYVTINNKKYIVRLIRAYNDKVGINDNHNWTQYSISHYNATKGSEWNRLILPLIADGRYGSDTKNFVESNMSVIANYSWWTDFGGKSNRNGEYSPRYDYGVRRWAQETGNNISEYRILRGSDNSSSGAGDSFSNIPYYEYVGRGWQPVLERVDN